MRSYLAMVLATVLMIALAGCAPATIEPSPTPPPSASADASSTPAPTPTPDAGPEPFTISGCEAMLPLPLAQELFSANTEFFGESPAVGFSGSFAVPAIQSALSTAPQARLCSWGVPSSDGAFALVVAELPAPDQAPVIAALTTAGFAPSSSGTETTLRLEQDGLVSSEAQTHIFTGAVWILVDGTSAELTDAVAASALTVLRAANPALSF